MKEYIHLLQAIPLYSVESEVAKGTYSCWCVSILCLCVYYSLHWYDIIVRIATKTKSHLDECVMRECLYLHLLAYYSTISLLFHNGNGSWSPTVQGTKPTSGKLMKSSFSVICMFNNNSVLGVDTTISFKTNI